MGSGGGKLSITINTAVRGLPKNYMVSVYLPFMLDIQNCVPRVTGTSTLYRYGAMDA